MLARERRSLQTYLNSVGPFIPLSREEGVALAKRVEAGDRRAYEELILANLRLVAKEAFRYRRMFDVDILDLIQEGNRGLMKAVEKFDWRRGVLFNTYAMYWVRAHLIRYCTKNSSTVRISLPVQKSLRGIRMERSYFYRMNGRMPTSEELAKAMEIPVEVIEEILAYDVEVMSLDKERNSDESGRTTTLHDSIADDSTPSPEEAVDAGDIKKIEFLIRENYQEYYRRFHPYSRHDISRDTDVFFRHVYGETLQSIGDDYNVSRERIRQIYERAEKTARKILRSYGIYPDSMLVS